MGFLGKILVVLHLVLSVLFMAFAGGVYTAQTNWRTERDKVAEQLNRSKNELKDRTAELQASQASASQKVQQLEASLAQLTGEKNTLADEVKALELKNLELKTAEDSQREVAILNSTEAAERTKESALQREKNVDLYRSRDELLAEARLLKDKIFALEYQQQELQAKHDLVLKDVSAMRAFLASKDLPTDPKQMATSDAPPPPVDGIVLDVRSATKGTGELVEISIGSDDGLASGHTLTMFRSDKYLGRVRLVYVTPDRAVGAVVDKAKNSKIERGDHVSTKL
jgi:hypothetical protein